MCLLVLTLVHLVHIEQKNTSHNSHTTTHNDTIPKRRKKSPPPVILAAPTPALVPLIAAANAPEAVLAKVPEAAAAKAPEAAVAKAPAMCPTHPEGPTHLEGIVIKIVSITTCNQGRSCEEHPYCGEIIEENVVVHLCCVQVIMPLKNGGPGQEVTTAAVYWVTNKIDHCRVVFLPHHMAKYATRYDGVLAQATETFSPAKEGNKLVHKKYHCNKGFCRAVIILVLNNN